VVNRVLKSAVFAILALLPAGIVNAQSDGKSYSPIFCTAAFKGTAYPNPTHGITPWYFSNASGDSTMMVSCPIIKDNQDSLSGLEFAVIYVTNPSGHTTTCHIYSVNLWGDNTLSYQKAETAVAGNQALYLYPYPSKSDAWGTYGIICSLPPGAAIRSYTIYER
jgi:hypothetical protein